MGDGGCVPAGADASDDVAHGHRPGEQRTWYVHQRDVPSRLSACQRDQGQQDRDQDGGREDSVISRRPARPGAGGRTRPRVLRRGSAPPVGVGEEPCPPVRASALKRSVCRKLFSRASTLSHSTSNTPNWDADSIPLVIRTARQPGVEARIESPSTVRRGEGVFLPGNHVDEGDFKNHGVQPATSSDERKAREDALSDCASLLTYPVTGTDVPKGLLYGVTTPRKEGGFRSASSRSSRLPPVRGGQLGICGRRPGRRRGLGRGRDFQQGLGPRGSESGQTDKRTATTRACRKSF